MRPADEALRRELERAVTRLALGDEILRIATAVAVPRDVAQAAVHLVGRAVACRRISLVTFDFDAREAAVLAVHGEARLASGGPLAWAAECGLVARLAGGEAVRELLALADRARMRQALQPSPAGECLTFPLVTQDDLVGSLNLWPEPARPLHADEIALASELAAHVALALQNARLYEAEQRERQAAGVLRSASLTLTRTLDLRTVLDTFVDHLTQAVPSDLAAVVLLGSGAPPEVRAWRGSDLWADGGRIERTVARIRRSAVGRRWLGGRRALLIADTLTHPAWPQAGDTAGIRCWIGGPLFVDWKRIGAYCLGRLDARSYSHTHVELCESLAAQAASAIENARLFGQVRSAREQLATLANRLVAVQEGERRQLARELHDEVGQSLTGLTLMLDTLPRLPEPQRQARLEQARGVAGSLLTQIRLISLALRPAMLDDLGLLPALLWLFERYTASMTVRVAFAHVGLERRFGTEIETAMYRIVQEALTNVARHAGTEEVHVRLGVRRHLLRLEVGDQGRGFDPEQVLRRGNSGGLVGMRERMGLLGGRLKITSRPGRGTRLVALVPLEVGSSHVLGF